MKKYKLESTDSFNDMQIVASLIVNSRHNNITGKLIVKPLDENQLLKEHIVQISKKIINIKLTKPINKSDDTITAEDFENILTYYQYKEKKYLDSYKLNVDENLLKNFLKISYGFLNSLNQ